MSDRTVPQIHHWFDGKEVAGTSECRGLVFNPASGEPTGVVDFASGAEVEVAIDVAVRAAREWGESSLARRAAVLFAFRELLASRTTELAALVTAELGKVRADAVNEVARGLEQVEFACGVPHLLKGSYSVEVRPGVDVCSMRHPLGVVAGITPFNFPVMVPLWMCTLAIACGNAFVLKPSEKDPSAALFLARLWQEAGLPDGVFTVVQGNEEAVDALIADPRVAGVSFVGSTPVARYVYETASAHGKRVQALGGAKNHMVVLPDADIEQAATAAVAGAYESAGERCMAISVAVVVGDVGDALVEAIAQRLPRVVVGDGSDPLTDMGPLISAEHRDRVAGYIAAGQSAGASVVVDGRASPVPESGFFLGVTLLDNVTPDMTVYTEEIFGPVLCVVRVDSFEEAVSLVNLNAYANGAAIFTRDGGAARSFQLETEVGMVGVNVPIPVPVAAYSFGGWRSSLFGDTNIYGTEGIHFYTRSKVVTTRWPDPTTSQADLGFSRTW